MRNYSILSVLLVLLFSVVVSAQNKESRDVGSFKGIKVSEGIDVILQKSGSESVIVESDRLDVSKVKTEVEGGGILHIYLSGNGRSNKITVYVNYTQIKELSASSAAAIYSESLIVADHLEITASSAANIELKIDADHADVSVSSSGDVELSGKVDHLEIKASSAGEVDAYDLSAKNVEARVSSAGTIRISVIDEIIANASSGGSIRYRGNPRTSDTSSSSGGWIRNNDK